MSFSINNVSMKEGTAGPTTFEFTVTDAGGQAGDTVYFQTKDGTATVADGDYQATSGLLTFDGSDTPMTIDVLVNGDGKYEADESFYVNLYQQAQSSTVTQTITATTTTTATALTVVSATSFTSVTRTFTSTSLTTSTILVQSSMAVPTTITITESPITTDGYSSSQLAVVFLQNARSKAVLELNRSVTAADESGPPPGYTLLAAQGTATVVNDDPAPTFSITGGPNVAEGDQLVFTVTRTNDAQDPETVTVRTSDGTATQGRDYTANATALTFTQGMLSQTFTVQTNRDGLYNGPAPETVNATLSLATGGATGDGATASGGIVDRDPAPTLALSPANIAQNEGNSGETDYVYTVTRNGDAQPSQTVGYSVAGSGASPADGADFVGGQLPSGTLTFATGQSTQTLTVRVAGDTTYEPNETFTVSLGAPNFGAVSTGTATGTIVNDDAPPASTQPPGPSPVPPAPVAPDAVTINRQVSFRNGVFTLTGTASSVAGGGTVEISAVVDGGRQVLGTAAVGSGGTFTFGDLIGSATQGFFQAKLTDGAGGMATSADPGFSLTGGLTGAYKARQDRYNADGSAVVATDKFKADGSQQATLPKSSGETFASASFDTFNNGGAPLSTFVFDPGAGLETVNGFRPDNADHDTLSFKRADFGNSVATVLNNAQDTAEGLLITDPVASSPGPGPGNHDTVLLKNVTLDQLTANQGDIKFHA